VSEKLLIINQQKQPGGYHDYEENGQHGKKADSLFVV
jgi:hypothetical protein